MRYPDKWLRLISYPALGVFIRLFGDMAPLGDLLKRPLFYADVAWDILIVAASWEANRRLIMYLDQHYSWTTDKFKRFVIQFFTALPMTFAIVIPMIYLWNEVLTNHGGFNTANLLVNDFPLTIVFTSMVHLAYTSMYFYYSHEETIAQLTARIRELETAVAGVGSAEELNKPSGYRELLVVNYGNSSVPVHTGDIAYFYKQNEVSFIKTFDGKEYTSSSSLEQLEAMLDPTHFFRINRQFIGSLKSIRQFRSDTSGKLVLEIHPAFGEAVTVSKKKAAEFRSWIERSV